jgi:hypothetical protein
LIICICTPAREQILLECFRQAKEIVKNFTGGCAHEMFDSPDGKNYLAFPFVLRSFNFRMWHTRPTRTAWHTGNLTAWSPRKKKGRKNMSQLEKPANILSPWQKSIYHGHSVLPGIVPSTGNRRCFSDMASQWVREGE